MTKKGTNEREKASKKSNLIRKICICEDDRENYRIPRNSGEQRLFLKQDTKSRSRQDVDQNDVFPRKGYKQRQSKNFDKNFSSSSIGRVPEPLISRGLDDFQSQHWRLISLLKEQMVVKAKSGYPLAEEMACWERTAT